MHFIPGDTVYNNYDVSKNKNVSYVPFPTNNQNYSHNPFPPVRLQFAFLHNCPPEGARR